MANADKSDDPTKVERNEKASKVTGPVHAAAVGTTDREGERTVSFLKRDGDRVSHTVPAGHGLLDTFHRMLEQFEKDFEGVAASFETEKKTAAANSNGEKSK